MRVEGVGIEGMRGLEFAKCKNFFTHLVWVDGVDVNSDELAPELEEIPSLCDGT